MCIDSALREKYIQFAEKKLTESRFNHCLRTEQAAVNLARRYGASVSDASAAGLLHDVEKKLPRQEKLELYRKYNLIDDRELMLNPDLMHGPLAAETVKRELGIKNEDVLNAIRYHTTGRANMSKLEKIVYLADLIEDGRDFEGVDDLREAANADLDNAVFMAMRYVLINLVKRGVPINKMTIDGYNYMVEERGYNGK